MSQQKGHFTIWFGHRQNTMGLAKNEPLIMIQLKHQFKLPCGFVEYHDVPYTGKQHNSKGMTQLAVIA